MHRGVGDLDNEKRVFRKNTFRCIEILARTGQHDIRLGFGIPAQANRILDADHDLSCQASGEESGRAIDARDMAITRLISMISPSISSRQASGWKMPAS